MPSMRRMRGFGVIVFCAVIYVLYITSNGRHTRSPDFYSKTKQALDRDKGLHHPHSRQKGADIDNEDEAVRVDMANRLMEAEQAAKDNANAKSPKPEAIDSTQKKAKAGVQDVTPDNKAADDGKEKVLDQGSGAEEYSVESEMNQILKRSPIIIFSKSYCPHSKRAKGILLDKYSIVPAPYVLELDLHPTGAQLQDKLAEMTGRRTVPNVLINGKSIGGGEDVAELDQSMKLIDKIKSLGGKQMQTVQERS